MLAALEAIAAGEGRTLLHFAGHGSFGQDAWSARLLLARRGGLAARDIVLLPTVPDEVLMSACEGSRSADTAVEGLGLAQAFLIAGAEGVLAADRPVSDAGAAAYSEAVVGLRWSGSSLGSAHAEAVEALREAGSEDWSAFRYWIR